MIPGSEKFDFEEFVTLSKELEGHHSIFNALWSMSKPSFSDTIDTAGVYFDSVGETIDFRINKKFWDSLSPVRKRFIICHECLHVILYHGIRLTGLPKSCELNGNYAADIVVNHLLVDRFQFKRKEVDPENKLCWTNTCFEKKIPPSGKSFEYYYNLLMKQTGASGEEGEDESDGEGGADNKDSEGSQPQQGGLADDHSGLHSFNTKEFEELLKDIPEDTKDTIKDMVEGHIEDIQNEIREAGCSPGNIWLTVNVGYVKTKSKWETVIKKWASKYMKEAEHEQWARLQRRLQFMAGDIMLPSDVEVEHFEKDRIQVWFFQDTSGSCYGFIDRFFKAAASLDPKRFDIKMHCFDTRVYETTLESKKLYGFGGTRFDIIEDYIQRYIRTNNLKYPKAVFVITDGYGNRVQMEKPSVWHWFLSTGDTYCIPDECNIHSLRNYE